jgi:adenylate kinase family enzyme
MSTSIKISEKAKRVLDTIQARITLATGKKYSQQELLDMIIESSDDNKEEIVRRLTKVKLLSKKEIDALKKLSIDWGVHTNEEDIDLYLYGGKE